MRDALSLLDQVLSYAGETPEDAAVIEALGIVDRQTVFDLCDAVLARDADRMLSTVAEVDARGHDLNDLASLLVEHLRDLMVVKVVSSPSEALLERSPGEVEALNGQAEKLSRPDLHRYFAVAVNVAEDVARSTMPRISLEMGLLRLLEIEPTSSLAELLEKLDGVVAGGGSGEVSAKAPRAAETKPSTVSTRQVEAPETRADVEPRPASPAPPPSKPSGDDESPPTDGWMGLVDRVRTNRPALASLLEHGRPLRFDAEGVDIGYPKGTFYLDSAQERDNREALEAILAEHFGKRVPLRIQAAEADAVQTLAETQAQQRRDREREIRDGALDHPAVREAISVLGGEVKEVIPLGVQGDDPA